MPTGYFLRWRIRERMRRFLRPSFRRPLPVFLTPTNSSPTSCFAMAAAYAKSSGRSRSRPGPLVETHHVTDTARFRKVAPATSRAFGDGPATGRTSDSRSKSLTQLPAGVNTFPADFKTKCLDRFLGWPCFSFLVMRHAPPAAGDFIYNEKFAAAARRLRIPTGLGRMKTPLALFRRFPLSLLPAAEVDRRRARHPET